MKAWESWRPKGKAKEKKVWYEGIFTQANTPFLVKPVPEDEEFAGAFNPSIEYSMQGYTPYDEKGMLISGYPAPSRHWEFGLDLLSDLKWFAHHMAWSIANGSDEYQMGFAERDEEGVKYFYDLIEPYLEKLHTPGPGYGKLAEAPKVFSDKFNANDVDSDSWTWYAADKEGDCNLPPSGRPSTWPPSSFCGALVSGPATRLERGSRTLGPQRLKRQTSKPGKTSRNTETRLQRTQRQERLTTRLRTLYAKRLSRRIGRLTKDAGFPIQA